MRPVATAVGAASAHGPSYLEARRRAEAAGASAPATRANRFSLQPPLHFPVVAEGAVLSLACLADSQLVAAVPCYGLPEISGLAQVAVAGPCPSRCLWSFGVHLGVGLLCAGRRRRRGGGAPVPPSPLGDEQRSKGMDPHKRLPFNRTADLSASSEIAHGSWFWQT